MPTSRSCQPCSPGSSATAPAGAVLALGARAEPSRRRVARADQPIGAADANDELLGDLPLTGARAPTIASRPAGRSGGPPGPEGRVDWRPRCPTPAAGSPRLCRLTAVRTLRGSVTRTRRFERPRATGPCIRASANARRAAAALPGEGMTATLVALAPHSSTSDRHVVPSSSSGRLPGHHRLRRERGTRGSNIIGAACVDPIADRNGRPTTLRRGHVESRGVCIVLDPPANGRGKVVTQRQGGESELEP
jgi:hypothetical protein